jgi:hypothetical protein
MKNMQQIARQIVVDNLVRGLSKGRAGVADRHVLDRFVVPDIDSSQLGFLEYIESASAGASRNAQRYGFA